jgi:hypothetical protein
VIDCSCRLLLAGRQERKNVYRRELIQPCGTPMSRFGGGSAHPNSPSTKKMPKKYQLSSGKINFYG